MFGEGYSHWVFGGDHRRGRGGGGEGPPGGGHRGRRRLFDGGELKLVLLRLIADQPRHGYDLIRAIEALSGGVYAPSPGVVYPTLTLLGDMGLIEEQDGGGQRRSYAVGPAGAALLAEKADEVAALIARLDEVAASRARTDVAPVRRAMHNLRQVLHDKLGEEGLERDRMHQAVALIDEVAGRIERL